MMKKNFATGVLAGLLVVFGCIASPLCAEEAAPENLVANGSFETGVEGWRGHLMDFNLPAAEQKEEDHPEFLSWEQKDTGDKSKGALRVSIKSKENQKVASSVTGALCTLSRVVPIGNEMRISFKAKSPTDGTYLQVERLWGGTKFGNFKLTTEWKNYEVAWTPDFATNVLVLSIVGNDEARAIKKVLDGEFLIDDLKIVEIPKKAEEPKRAG